MRPDCPLAIHVPPRRVQKLGVLNLFGGFSRCQGAGILRNEKWEWGCFADLREERSVRQLFRQLYLGDRTLGVRSEILSCSCRGTVSALGRAEGETSPPSATIRHLNGRGRGARSDTSNPCQEHERICADFQYGLVRSGSPLRVRRAAGFVRTSLLQIRQLHAGESKPY